jgi:hypothetical protein
LNIDIQVLAAIVTAVGVIIGGYYTLAALVVRQFKAHLDERFAAQEKARQDGRKLYEERLARVEDAHRELDRAFLKHLAELPRDYVRREDHIRFETVINAKLDAVAAKQDLLAERMLRRD